MKTKYELWTQTNFSALEARITSALTGNQTEKGEQINEWETFDPNDDPDAEPEKTALLMEKVKGIWMMEIIRMDGDRVKSIVKVRRTPQTEGELLSEDNGDEIIREIGKQIHLTMGEECDTVIKFINNTNATIAFNSINEIINRVQTTYKVYSEEYIPKNSEAPELKSFEVVGGPTDVELSNNFVMKCTETTSPEPKLLQVMESIKGIKEIVYTRLCSLSGNKYTTTRIERTPPTEGDLLTEGTMKLKSAAKQIRKQIKQPSRLNLIRSIEFVNTDGISVVFKN